MPESFDPAVMKTRNEPSSVILVQPTYFQVVDSKNPYMKSPIDHKLALKQWEDMKTIYAGLVEEGILQNMHIIDGVENLEDMVFCANQSLPWMADNGSLNVVMSNMRYPSRMREVIHFREFYETEGYEVHTMPSNILMEGMGDCIFHPFTSLLWMGHGFRTSDEAAPILTEKLKMPVIPLRLTSDYFYHLDTCFLPVNEHKVLLCTEAFDNDALISIRSVFKEVVEVSREEAVGIFSLNTHCIYDRDHPVAVMPKGDGSVKDELLKEGYRIIETDTSEFIKSGGSVYCMKMMYY